MVAKRHVEVTMACAHGLAADRAVSQLTTCTCRGAENNKGITDITGKLRAVSRIQLGETK
jgi:hypothetical protein